MRRLVQPLAAFVLVAFTAIGLVERAALHAHPLEESDLVPHELMIVEGGPACGGASHVDSARRADHPVCVDCALSASVIAIGPVTAVRLSASAPSSLGRRPTAARGGAACCRSTAARAPPGERP